MKKILVILFCLSIITVTACGNGDDSEKAKESSQDEEISQEADDESTENEKLEVDEGLLNVTITIPAAMIEDEDIDKEVEDIKEEGIKDVKVNDDGSITVKMSKSKHKELVKEMRKSVLEYFGEIENSEETPSINSIEADKNFKNILLEVDRKRFEESFDSLSVFGVAMSTAMYHIYEGVPAEDVNFKIDMKDSNNGEIFNTIIYPDFLEDMEDLEGMEGE